jgi:phage shock protein C
MEHQPHRKLYRSKTNKIFGGVCGGLAEYFNIDPTILRVLFVLFIIFTGFFPGVFFYIIALFIIPEQK